MLGFGGFDVVAAWRAGSFPVLSALQQFRKRTVTSELLMFPVIATPFALSPSPSLPREATEGSPRGREGLGERACAYNCDVVMHSGTLNKRPADGASLERGVKPRWFGGEESP